MNIMQLFNIFNDFCNYIDNRIFSKDNMGTSVAFVVDSSLINDYCRRSSISEKDLMNAVRHNLYSYSNNIVHIKGILAIQLYAASKRANEEDVSVRNYKYRLSQILDWNLDDLNDWLEEFQEKYWESFYQWCDANFFFVAKCKPKTGTWRYVQYPLMQSRCVFTNEDFKYIACAFVDHNLVPGEDLSETEFWKNVRREYITEYFTTSHSKGVKENSRTEEDYLKQIFNFYLRWNGEYKRKFNSQIEKQKGMDTDRYLYLTGDFTRLEVRNSNLELIKRFNISQLKYTEIVKSYYFKRKGLILFKKDDIYENYWQETRYLTTGEEGIAIVFIDTIDNWNNRMFDTLVKIYANISIYKVTEFLDTKDLYTTKRFYSLEGGLKIGRQMYIEGAGPILSITEQCKYWIDGNLNETSQRRINLSRLATGNHTIRFLNYRKIEFQIVSATVSSPRWLDSYNKWTINRQDNQWKSEKQPNGIIGLDFTTIPQKLQFGVQGTIINRWGKMMVLGVCQSEESNVVVKTLANIKEYEYI